MIAITDGTYAENVVVQQKTVRIWARCPSRVAIQGGNRPGTGWALAFGLADDSEVHGLALTGTGQGLALQATTGLMVDSVWIHDTGYDGIEAAQAAAPHDTVPTLHVTNSLVEGATVAGVLLRSAEATIEKSVVRDTVAGATPGAASRPSSRPPWARRRRTPPPSTCRGASSSATTKSGSSSPRARGPSRARSSAIRWCRRWTGGTSPPTSKSTPRRPARAR